MPLKPFPLPSNGDPSFEAVEFSGNADRDMYPYTTFINHLFVYPLTLSFDSQKLFSRARNLALVMEIRDSDEEDAKAIPVITTFFLVHFYQLRKKKHVQSTIYFSFFFLNFSVSMVDRDKKYCSIIFRVQYCITIQILHGTKRSKFDYH